MTARIDVPPGTVFGRLTVIAEAPSSNRKRAMLCRCECGSEKIVSLTHLMTGHTTSCGCLSNLSIAPGTVFGRWTVIHEGPPTASGQRTMLCECECRTRGIVHLGNLRRGGSQSCGCARGAVVDTSRLQPGEVALHGKDAHGRVALVDVADYELVMRYRWRLVERSQGADRRSDGPYARATLPRSDDGKVTHLYMHALIMGQPYIDHANGNGLDNRRSNLRAATVSQNSANRPGHSSSGFKGVHRQWRGRPWIARINANGKRRSLGCFDDPADAARAYDAAALEAYGEFAWLNFPGTVRLGTGHGHRHESGVGRREQATQTAVNRLERSDGGDLLKVVILIAAYNKCDRIIRRYRAPVGKVGQNQLCHPASLVGAYVHGLAAHVEELPVRHLEWPRE